MNTDLVKNEIKNIGQTNNIPMAIINGLIDNLPDILATFSEIHKTSKSGELKKEHLKHRLEELKINKENFAALVKSLTELSKEVNVDEETKSLYKDMIRIMFKSFNDNYESSKDFSNHFNGA